MFRHVLDLLFLSELSTSNISTPVNHLTVEQAHKELKSLVDKIAAKFEQLESGEFGTVGTKHSMLSFTSWLSCLLASVLSFKVYLIINDDLPATCSFGGYFQSFSIG